VTNTEITFDDKTEDWLARGTYALAGVVGAVVLGVSSVYLFRYARGTQMEDWLAWTLPLALDAGGAGGTLAWLIGRGESRKWGRGVALANLVVSLLGNILGHLLAGHQIQSGAWLTVLTGAVYPAEAMALIHLVLLVRRDRHRAVAPLVAPAVPEPTPAPTPSITWTPITPTPAVPVVTRPDPIPTPETVVPPAVKPTTPPAVKPTTSPAPGTGVTPDLVARARKLRDDRAGEGLSCGRRVLVDHLGVSDGVARKLIALINQPTPRLERVS
jgi:hypothetical protein